jgi:pilus assembly protein Flp/PilA
LRGFFKGINGTVSAQKFFHGSYLKMRNIFAFLKDESGATAIEYGLIAAGISVVIIASVNAIGSTLNSKFQYISDQLK